MAVLAYRLQQYLQSVQTGQDWHIQFHRGPTDLEAIAGRGSTLSKGVDDEVHLPRFEQIHYVGVSFGYLLDLLGSDPHLRQSPGGAIGCDQSVTKAGQTLQER